MSLSDEQRAIAKVQAQGCRRWMSLIILAPVLLCAILTILAPNVREYLVKREANEQCQLLATQSEPVSNSTIFEDDTFIGNTVIAADNLEQLALLGETTFEASIPSRDTISAIAHPQSDYVIYVAYRPSATTNFFICDSNNALGAFSAGETAGDLVFNPDGTLFAVGEGRNGQVMVFDARNITGLETVNILGTQDYRQIDSLAFHPTEPLLFFTSENELYVYNTDTFIQLLRLPIAETNGKEIGFNVDGSLLYLAGIEENPRASVWGIDE